MPAPREDNTKPLNNKTDFYNPQGKPMHALLSRRENFKGRFLPRLVQVSLFALSIGITGAIEGPDKAAISAGFFAGVSVYLRRSATQKFNESVKSGETYDFSRPQDVLAFRHKYPTRQNLPAQFVSMSADAGFEKPPLFSVTATETFAVVGQTTFMAAKPEYAVRMGRSFLNDATPGLIAHVCAHELGHACRGHIGNGEPVAVLTAHGMHMKTGAALAFSGDLIGGAVYSAFGLGASMIARAKQMQSYEYEADRYALVKSGVIDEAAEIFERGHEKTPPLSQPVLRISFEIAKTRDSLLDNHPPSEKRAAYMRQYQAANEQIARQTRISVGVRP